MRIRATRMRPLSGIAVAAALLGAAEARDVAEAKHLSVATASLPSPGTYALDPPHTVIYFAAQHKIVGKVRGRFDKMIGKLVVAKDPAACSVEVSIEAASIDTQNGVRDGDLRGPDFFDATGFPTITFRGKGIRKSGDGWVVDGALTIRDVTKPVPLAFKFSGTAAAEAGKAARVGFHATAAVKRADFGMRRELLAEIGLESAAPDVWIEIDSEALEVAAPAK